MVLSVFALSFFALCLYAGFRDLSSLIIPNWLNAWLAFLFIPAAIVAAPGWETVGWHVLAGVIAFAICVVMFFTRIFGGGDAKMIPGVVLWLGPTGVMPFLYVMAIAGGILAVLILVARKTVPAHAVPGFASATLLEGLHVPYGIAIAAGAFYAAPHSPFLTDFLPQISSFH